MSFEPAIRCSYQKLPPCPQVEGKWSITQARPADAIELMEKRSNPRPNHIRWIAYDSGKDTGLKYPHVTARM